MMHTPSSKKIDLRPFGIMFAGLFALATIGAATVVMLFAMAIYMLLGF